ncbi:MAG: hypothetical protein AAB116_23770 [Candidatus Poribacteria bacterium]
MSEKVKYEPTPNYAIKKIEGWNIYVNKQLFDKRGKFAKELLKLIRVKLYDIKQVVPKTAIKKIQQTAIWLEFESKEVLCACYHPSEQWLIEHDFNPEKAKSVEIGNPDNFVKWILHQPSMVLHELAHAYHHRVLGYYNPDIKSAYNKAIEAGIYKSVLYCNGDNLQAYAINNDQEYFAELTEAYFGTNDYYPFVKAEVMKHDPLMYETLKKLWHDR